MELVNINGVGPVLFQVSAKAKRLSIKLKPFEAVKVVVPKTMAPKEALRFVQDNVGWIQQNMAKVKAKESELTIFDEHTNFKTKAFALRIEKSLGTKMNMQLRNGLLNIKYPSQQNVKSPVIQEHIRYAIEEALRVTAKNYLPRRLHELAQQHGFTYNRVFIKNLKSRWGSCSSVDNINLNLHLMRLPDHLIDSVLLHELCHTVEKNHGAGFWQLLDSVTGGKAKLLDREMKNYRTVIY